MSTIVLNPIFSFGFEFLVNSRLPPKYNFCGLLDHFVLPLHFCISYMHAFFSSLKVWPVFVYQNIKMVVHKNFVAKISVSKYQFCQQGVTTLTYNQPDQLLFLHFTKREVPHIL